MIDLALAAILIAIAALHAYWGVGGRWPAHDDLSLARTVAGFRGIRAMPSPAACFAVAATLVAAALWVLLVSGRIASSVPHLLLTAAGLVLSLVFLARGAAAYLPAWRRLTPEQPFARLDQSVYGPLCLAIGLAAAIVTVSGGRP